MKPRLEIEYCTQCRWLLRAAWMAQELLMTFESEIGGVVLVPGTGGIFEVRIDGDPIWSRAAQSRFPDIKELKQLARDRVAPGTSLGHADRAQPSLEVSSSSTSRRRRGSTIAGHSGFRNRGTSRSSTPPRSVSRSRSSCDRLGR